MGNNTSSRTHESGVLRVRAKRVLERFPAESIPDFHGRCLDVEQFLKDIRRFNPRIEFYQSVGQMIWDIKWDSIPHKDWDRPQCVIWIRAYLIKKIRIQSQLASKIACRFCEAGNWLICMEKKDWIHICRVDGTSQGAGGLSIWRRIEELKEKGLIDEDICQCK